MNNREFFNKVAFKWDEMCIHDDKKIKKIIELSNIRENSKILDVGTGTGVLIKYLIEKNPLKVVAVDIAEKMIEVAKSKYEDKRIQFIVSDIMDYKENKDFEYIFIYSAYPHFKDKNKLFRHLYDLISVGGKIIIAHSESKEKINEIHSKNENVKDDKLPPVDVTAGIMSKYFKVEIAIDNDEMYYISGVKKK
ncbi:demethylmenaquinone methyltransferase / 2-methoxy-6-polyprenyl-1,4-benzoquinol methylase [Caminicella sporogenes DSM 14501]|uniref:Demethylmenaquinone methyltransferase / 2-methoxy-6-polyprenyl-1,4-benzoquinol methylase n=1 Tax=Caminicella sporogenes DSM 14501 TaxID=1121266 RepID=A0A1M6NJ70_9FIRM|nr:class I SAM-dependent methyltransferase [Caminicella sporogenes]RKD22182.1 hypothetical protein BET04_06055 [Caminicella sporogenes]WIF95800.1 class I SAM-dependent methyltransferase [Caminicella sporogenes]SHJ95798.1 demethylmenaquinone methyltransferase / 2-methoxy-6-polyprenyl-1,4-benzoquinol methylase [Caminicella sporogenes DSM 14501]